MGFIENILTYLWVMTLGKHFTFTIYNDHKGRTKQPIRHIADHVVEVTENPEWSLAFEIVVTQIF